MTAHDKTTERQTRPAVTCCRAACFGISLVLGCSARAERIILDQPVMHFEARALGGTQTILRYELAAPDRNDTAILFLTAGESGGLPIAIQVLNKGEDRPPLDSQGGDCNIARVGLFRAGKDVALVQAYRTWRKSSPSLAEPAPMQIQLYVLAPDGSPGRSDPVFMASGRPTHSKPLCNIEDVDKAIEAAANLWRPSAADPPSLTGRKVR